MTIDVVNIVFSVWFKPALALILALSFSDRVFHFSASGSHTVLVNSVICIAVGAAAMLFIPALKLDIVPDTLTPLMKIPISAENTFFLFLYCSAIVYVFGLLCVVFYHLYGLWDIHKITKNASYHKDTRLMETLEHLRTMLGVTRNVRVAITSELSSPVVWRHRNPIIIFPENYTRWSDGRLQRILAHELSHVKRRDWLVHSCVRLICAIFWVVPFAWLVLKKIDWLAELSCDDAVIELFECRAEYAEDLLTLAGPTRTSAVALPLVRGSEAFARIQHVLDGRYDRKALSGRSRIAVVVTCLTVIIPVFSLQIAAFERAPGLTTTYALSLPETSPKHKQSVDPTVRAYLAVEKYIQILPDSPKFTEEMVVNAHVDESSLKSVITEGETTRKLFLPVRKIPQPRLEIKGALPRVMATPIYPKQAIRRSIEGQVIVQFDIDELGWIVNPRIVSSQPRGVFDSPVLAALKKSRYTPMELNGQPTKMHNIVQAFTFQLFESTTDIPPVSRLNHTKTAQNQ